MNQPKIELIRHEGSQSRLTLGLIADTLEYGYQATIWHGMVETARKHNVNSLCFLDMVLHSPYRLSALTSPLYNLVSEQAVDGLIIITSVMGVRASLEKLHDFCRRYHPLPVVSVGLALQDIPSIIVDNYQGMYDLVAHFVQEHGYHRIAFTQKQVGFPESDERYRAYVDALAAHNLPFDPDLVVPDRYYGKPSETVQWLVDERGVTFDALIAIDDYTALPLIAELNARGFSVPGDVAVAGFDDIAESQYTSPTLTTARQPLYELGQRATETVLSMLAQEQVSLYVKLPTKLMVRQSCGCLSQTASTTSMPALEQTTLSPGQAMLIAAANASETILPALSRHLLHEVTQALLTTFDVTELTTVIARELPRLGIPAYYLSLYDDEEQETEWAKLLIAYDERGRIDLTLDDRRFPSRQLLPGDVWPQTALFAMLVYPLCFRHEQLGFVLFEPGPRTHNIRACESLSGAISSAVKSALLVQEHKQMEEALEKTYAEVENQVEQRTAELQEEFAKHKQAEERLRASEERYKAIVELAPDGIVTVNLKGFVTSCNTAFVEVSGYTREEIVGRHFIQLPTLRLRDVPQFTALFASFIRGTPPEPVEFAWIHKDGSKRWAEARISTMKLGGKITGIQAVVRDTTEQRRATRLLYMLNQAALSVVKALTPQEIYAGIARELEQAGFSYAILLTDPDQRFLFPESYTYKAKTVKAIEKLLGIKAENFSISIESQETYQKIIWEQQTVFIETPEDVVKAILPEHLAKFAGQLLRMLRASKFLGAPLIVEGGVIGLVSLQSDDLFESDVPAVTAFAHQIAATLRKAQLFQQVQQELNERKRAEAEILRLQTLLQNVTDSMPSALIALDKDGRVLLWNPSAETFTGRDVVQGISLWELRPELARYRDIFEEVLQKNDVAHRHRDHLIAETGEAYYDVDVFPLVANGVEGAVLRIDDVTQWVQLEEMMLQSAKMANVGGLAAGVAHEINNPLAAMMQSAQMLQLAFDVARPRVRERLQTYRIDPDMLNRYLQDRGLLEYIGGIREAGERAAKIVSDLLSFSRQGVSQMGHHDLNALIEQTLDLAATDYDFKKRYDFRDIKIVRKLMPNLPSVVCDGQQIQQVILNLVRNAAQAVLGEAEKQGSGPSGYVPQLTLRTSISGETPDRGVQSRTCLRLEVEDNGPGIPEPFKARLFSPFFTTKEVGEGTGLGLWLCWSIVVERHKGRIWAEDVPEGGARFVVDLPITGCATPRRQ